jgi:hypothetical protein
VIDDFHDILATFVARDVRFVVVGAHALAAHGVPRVTGDLDLFVEPTPANAERIWESLTAFGAPLQSLGIAKADFTLPDQVVQLGVPPYRIDIMTSISAVRFDEARAGALSGTLFDVPVAYLGREEFIRNKRASGRDKDVSDLRSLGHWP